MKKLSLFSLLGLLASVTMPIYAQDVYFDENYIIVPEDTTVQNVDEEDVAVDEEALVDEVEEEIVNEIDNAVLAVEEEVAEDVADLDVIPKLDFLDLGELTQYPYQERSSRVSLESPYNANPLIRILAGGLGLFSVVLMYLILVYFALLPISAWEIYRRAGKKGWAFLVPYWGTMVYSEIAGMNKWLGLLPLVITIWGFFDGIVGSGVYGIVLNVLSILLLLWGIIANYRIARRYGWNIFASILHAILIFCPITILVLGLGNYKYQAKSEETVVEA